MRKFVIASFAAVSMLGGCAAKEPSLAEELSQESLSRVEEAPRAPKQPAVSEIPVDTPASTPSFTAKPPRPARKTVKAKPPAKKKQLAASKKQKKKSRKSPVRN